MKKIILYAAAALALVSCDKYLNQYPHNAVASDNLTEDDAEMLMTGVYNIAQYKPTFNGWALFDIIGGDLIRPGATSTNTPALVVQGAIGPDFSIVGGPWNGFYAGMYQINNFIQSVEKLPDSVKKDEMLGVGHFFRGLYYYNIVARWRDVPIVDHIISEDIAQTPEAQAWEFVASEFQLAMKMAPTSRTSFGAMPTGRRFSPSPICWRRGATTSVRITTPRSLRWAAATRSAPPRRRWICSSTLTSAGRCLWTSRAATMS